MYSIESGCGVLYRVRPTRVWRTLESMVTAVAMDSRVQKLPRVRGGSYTGVTRSRGHMYNYTVLSSIDNIVIGHDYSFIHSFIHSFRPFLYRLFKSTSTQKRSRRSTDTVPK